MSKKFIFHIDSGDEPKTITEENLAEYAHHIGLDRIASGRCSWLFVLNLFLFDKINGIDPKLVVEEIEVLEGQGSGIGTKPATQFKKEPLKGLWHKHFFSAHFVPRNLRNQLGKDGIKNLVEEVLDPAKSPVVTVDMVNELSRRVVIDSLEKREELHNLTGEWIIFKKYDSKNYYLCISTHKEGDQVIYDQIKSTCFQQFPFLEKCSG
jgi:hypothetical protein